MKHNIILDCLVGTDGKPIKLCVDDLDLSDLEEIRRKARESGKRLREAFKGDYDGT